MQFQGKIIHGQKIGRSFGVATANIETSLLPDLKEGVYFIEIIIDEKKEKGLMHFGKRKTFGASFSIEVHILDFSTNIYNKKVEIFVQKYLRPTQKFINADLLFTQIEKDIQIAEKYFLRKKIKKEWETYPCSKLRQKIPALIKKISKEKLFQSMENILVYAPSSREIPFIEPLMDYCPQKKYFFPRIEGKEMNFHRSRYKDLITGKFCLQEPCNQFPKFDFLEPFLVFVPAQAVDKKNYRLGRGGGFYDRFLEKFQKIAFSICVIPEFAFFDKIPKELHDKAVNKVFIL